MAPGYVNIYECPFGCKASGNRPIAASIRGWKKHMTRSHQGWNQEQLDVLIGTGARDPAAGREAFLAEADKEPSLFIGAEGVTDKPSPEQSAADIAAKTTELKTDAMARKFSGKINKMKKSIAEKFPQALSAAIKDKGPEWALSKEDSELFAESIENCFDVLDVDFRITPVSTILTNPLWVLVLPLLALVLIFVPKAVQSAQLHRERTVESESGSAGVGDEAHPSTVQ